MGPQKNWEQALAHWAESTLTHFHFLDSKGTTFQPQGNGEGLAIVAKCLMCAQPLTCGSSQPKNGSCV